MKQIDIKKLSNLIKMINSTPNAARISLEKFTKKNPNNIYGHICYSSVLIALNELEEADKELETVRQLIYTSSYLRDKPDLLEYYRHHLLVNRLKLFGLQNKSSEFLRLFNYNKSSIREVGPHDVIYFKHIQGYNPPPSYIPSYVSQQVLDYNEERFLEFVKRESRNNKNNEVSVTAKYGYFSDDFPYERVVEEIKKSIPSDKKINQGFCYNVYVFKYTGCGIAEEKQCNYFKVVTLNNTDHLISMYPVSEDLDIEYTDLNHLKNKNESDEKRLTMIDRFNKRYGTINQ